MLQDLFSRRISAPTNKNNLSSAIYQVVDVSVDYGRTMALSNVHLNIGRGEVVFVTGPSGAGKTTLLKVLSGEVDPTKGKVLKRRDDLIFASYVFQDLRLINSLSALENFKMVYDPSVYSGYSDFMGDLGELSSVFGLDKALNSKITQMNGGMKQKVSIVRALLAKPDVFIADEPTSSLDMENARRLFEVLNLYNIKRGLTVIWATHNRELIKKFNGRIVHLDKGKLVHSGHACFI